MSAFDRLQAWQFGATKFLVADSSVEGGQRDHVHEYPHSPGGAPEKFGRKLYVFRVQALFIAKEALTPEMQGRFPQAFPTDEGVLRADFEDGLTLPLTVPTIGTIQAYAIDWIQRKSAKDHSGVIVDITFREDQDSALLANILNVNFDGIGSTLDNLAAMRAIIFAASPEPSIFSKINDLAVQVLAIKDESDLFGNLISSKVNSLAVLIGQADAQVKELNHPDNQGLTEALHELWSATVDLQKDIRQTRGTLLEFVTPLQMPISAVSVAIFGDSTHALDIMQLNPIEDPLDIPAGTRLQYYAAAA